MPEELKVVGSNIDNVTEALSQDPYVGYDSIDAAEADCQATTQVEVLARLFNGENIFISGPAGSGKSAIVQPFINYLNREQPDTQIAVTAYTGIAATLIDGSTLHSWSGVGSKDIYYKIENCQKVQVLVIDEVSMIPAYLFEKLDRKMQIAKQNTEPFGGIQLVLLGDFMQLPPVPERDKNTDFCLATESWRNAGIRLCYIDKVRRAKDPELQNVLSAISRSKVDDTIRGKVIGRMNASKDPDKTYVNLFTTNRKIDDYNIRELEKIDAPIHKYSPSIFYSKNWNEDADKKVQEFLKNANIKDLYLKVGATVILTRNISTAEYSMIPNGSIGVVVEANPGVVKVRFNSFGVVDIFQTDHKVRGKRQYITAEGVEHQYPTVLATIQYMPLRLGFAISVHKSQGQTYDGVVVDLSNSFVEGLGYVALSRVRDLGDLILTGIGKKALEANPRSLRISNIVKKGALKNRREFLENKEHYDSILSDEDLRRYSCTQLLSL